MPVSKIISLDKKYIDYLWDTGGVRVWEHQCQLITRKDSESEWSECGDARSIPVVHDFQDHPLGVRLKRNPLDLDLAGRIRELGSDELKGLTNGEISFARAIST